MALALILKRFVRYLPGKAAGPVAREGGHMNAEPDGIQRDQPLEAAFSITGDNGSIADARDFTTAFLRQAHDEGIFMTTGTVMSLSSWSVSW